MIYVIELPKDARPRGWFAFDAADFKRKVKANMKGEGVIYESTSPGKLLADAGYSPELEESKSSCSSIWQLAEQHGWETPLYRADFLLENTAYQTEELSELDAYAAAIAANLEACRVYLSDNAAVNALYQDPLYQGREGFYAHMALREQLIAMEVISDDL